MEVLRHYICGMKCIILEDAGQGQLKTQLVMEIKDRLR